MFKESYKKLFWGFIIVLLDLRFNNFNILPDVIGYLMIVVALGQLENQHQYYGKAKNFAMLLILFAIPDIYQNNNGLQGFRIGDTYSLAIFVLSGVGIIINIFMVYYICQGIFQLSEERQLHELSSMATGRWRGYLIINTILLALMPLIINIGQNTAFMIIAATGLMGFVIQIILISLIKQAGNQLSNDGSVL